MPINPQVLTNESRDLPEGCDLAQILKGHSGLITQVAWSPTDNQILGSVSSDETIRIWNVTTGKQELNVRREFGIVHSLTWSPSGIQIATGHGDDSIRIWDIVKRGLIRTLKGQSYSNVSTSVLGKQEGHKGSVRSVAWSPDGKFLASGSDDHTIRLWDMRNGNLSQVLEPHLGSILCLSWSPDGQKLAAGSEDSSISLWSFSDSSPVKDHHQRWWLELMHLEGAILLISQTVYLVWHHCLHLSCFATSHT